jgi:1-aminocyclopropane-1-carboxylate deaminase
MINQHLNIPSPLHEVDTPWLKEANCQLFIKRDDLIHPLISGNKWRKLSGLLKEATDFETIKTFGGAYSNHLVATAVVTSILGKKSIGVIRGEKPKRWSKVLELCRLYGMELDFVSRQEYALIKHTNALKGEVLTIAEGGAHSLGLEGCADIIKELPVDDFDKIVVSCGTGTTYAGMYNELKQTNQEHKLVGIQVLKGENYIAHELQQKFKIRRAHILDNYHLGGYAKTNDELFQLISDFTKQTGVLLDPIYTGKALYAIRDLIQKGIWSKQKIVLIHTGGLTGWFGKWDDLFKPSTH